MLIRGGVGKKKRARTQRKRAKSRLASTVHERGGKKEGFARSETKLERSTTAERMAKEKEKKTNKGGKRSQSSASGGGGGVGKFNPEDREKQKNPDEE